jgi:SAM-dependent methyltransferase
VRASPREWFRGFFDATYLASDGPAVHGRRARGEIDFATRVLALRPGARVLDVPCGFGRHSGELARRGYSVVGVDLSPTMLGAARRAHGKSPRLRFVRGDMRRLAYRAEFDGLICLFTSFGYFGERENVATLRRFARALRPGARLLIDHRNPHHDATLPVHSWRRAGRGHFVLMTLTYDRKAATHESVWLFLRPGSQRVIRKSFRVRLWTLAQWRRRLREAGFRLVRAYADYEGRAYRRSSGRLLILAERVTKPRARRRAARRRP